MDFLPFFGFFNLVPFGSILNVFVTFPVYLPLPVMVSVALPTFLLFL